MSYFFFLVREIASQKCLSFQIASFCYCFYANSRPLAQMYLFTILKPAFAQVDPPPNTLDCKYTYSLEPLFRWYIIHIDLQPYNQIRTNRLPFAMFSWYREGFCLSSTSGFYLKFFLSVAPGVTITNCFIHSLKSNFQAKVCIKGNGSKDGL